MERFRIEAARFAKAGYLAAMFDYRGWGESDGRVILAAPAPAERQGTRFAAEVVELREIRDPHAVVEDLFNVMHWVEAEPQSDTSRIGIWGTSYGGGVAASVAGYDHRVKAIHAQVAPLDLLTRSATAMGQSGREANSNTRKLAWSSSPVCWARPSPSTLFIIRLLRP
jgi:dienelactone hydrolase